MFKDPCKWIIRCLFPDWESTYKLFPGKNFQPKVINTKRRINNGKCDLTVAWRLWYSTQYPKECCSHCSETILSSFRWVTIVYCFSHYCSKSIKLRHQYKQLRIWHWNWEVTNFSKSYFKSYFLVSFPDDTKTSKILIQADVQTK